MILSRPGGYNSFYQHIVNVTEENKGMENYRKRNLLKYKCYYLLLLPAILYYLVFNYVTIGGITVAFFDYNIFKGFSGSEWVGLKWFIQLFTLQDFAIVLKNTVIISFYNIAICFPAPIILALMLNDCRNTVFKRIIQTVTYLPHFLSWSIVAGLVVVMLSPSSGIVNQAIKLLGFEPVYFMVESRYIRGIMVLANLWKSIGWSTIIYLAALTNIPQEQYESAILDGATRFQQTIFVTLPGMSNIIIMTFIFAVSGLFSVGFEMAYNFITPPTYETGQVISTYIYNIGIRNLQYSFTTAVGMAQSLLALLLLAGANKIVKKYNDEAAIW